MYGYRYSDRFQMLASHGYGVVFINPRGSRGYGQTFADGCVLNWGGGDYQDLMAGVDHAIEQNGWIDAERLGVIGGSYGGFMTNWIITQTDRFKAAIPVASVSNLISFYGTSLYQLLIEVEFNGKPWDNYAMLWQWSPLNHIKNVTTPTLLIHGENDHDVPITQAEEMYIAIKKLGVDATFVRYPGEGHGIRKPSHVMDYRRRILDWFDQYVKSMPAENGTK
jgi:dipeptidyl aminopeptidase/acylaminoacyl peptidase